MKKTLSILLSFVMIFSIFANVSAADIEDFEDPIYSDEAIESNDNFNPDDWIDDSVYHDAFSVQSAVKDTSRYTVLTLDVSGSMSGTPISKLKEASKNFVSLLLNSRGTNYIAIVKFASSASIACGFTNDPEELNTAIDSLSANGGTDTAYGLQKSKELYESAALTVTTERNIVLISDGSPNSEADAQTEANKMFFDYNIYSLGYNMSSSEQKFMKTVQNCGYCNATNDTELDSAVTEIANTILTGSTGSISDYLPNTTSVYVYENRKNSDMLSTDFVLSSDAVITLGNNTYTTDISGKADIPTITSGSISVEKEGYVKQTVSAKQLENSPKIYLQKISDKPVINSVYVNNVDVLNDTFEIEMESKEQITIVADIKWKDDVSGTLYLYQKGVTEYFSDNTLITVLSDKFDTSETIYIAASDNNGNIVKKKLNFSGKIPECVDGLKLSFKSTPSLTMPESFPFIGGGSIKVGFDSDISSIIPVNVAIDDNKAFISIGIDLVSYSYSDKFASSNETGNRAHVLKNETKTAVSKIKSLYEDQKNSNNASSKMSAVKKLKNIKTLYSQCLKYPKGAFGFNADFTVLGFAEGYIDSNGQLVIVDGGAIFNPSVSASWDGQFALGPVPMYWEAAISAAINAQLNLYKSQTAKNFVANGILSGSLSLEGGLGAGFKKVLSAGGGITGTLSPYYELTAQLDNYFKLDGSLDAYFKATFLGFEYKKPFNIASGTLLEYPSLKTTEASCDISIALYEEDSYELVNRDYLNMPTEFLANNEFSLAETNNEKTIKSNVYTYSSPLIGKFSDGSELLLWLDDVPERSDINRTALYYSYYSNGAYSDPAIIDDDGTADYNPYLKIIDDKAYIAWSDENTVLSDSDSLSTASSALDICTAVFDNGSIEVFQLSDDTITDFSPIVFGDSTSVYCMWISASKGIFDETDSYSINISEICSEPYTTELASGIESIESMSGAVYDGSYHFAYTVDTDSNLETVNDIEVFVDNERFTANDLIDSNVVLTDKAIYWYCAGQICYMPHGTSDIKYVNADTDLISTDAFKVYENQDGNIAVLFNMYTGNYSDIYGYIYYPEEDRFGSRVQLTDKNSIISSYDCIFNNDVSLDILANITQVSEEDNGLTDLVLLYSNDEANISIEDVIFDPSNIIAGYDLPVTVNIKNNGIKNIDNIRVEISTKNSSSIVSYDLPDTLAAGDEIPVDLTCEIPEYFTEDTLTVTLYIGDTVCDYNDTELSYVDYSVERASYSLNNDGKAIVTANIVNRGYGNEDIINVSLRKDSEEGDVLYTKEVFVPTLLDSMAVAFEVDYENGNVFYITIDSDDDDTGNNSDFVYLQNIEYEITENGAILISVDCGDSTEYTVPEYIDGHMIVGLGDCLFEGLDKLQKITLTDNITSIGTRAFAGCTSLKEITIPSSVVELGDEIFVGCTNLSSLEVESGNKMYKSNNGVLINSDTGYILYCTKNYSGSYTAPSGITGIAPGAFEDCNSITEITLPNCRITGNSSYAFKGCSSLKSVNFDGTIEEISEGMFIGCSSLEQINLHDGIKAIYSMAFKNCVSLKNVYIGKTAEKIEFGAFTGANAIEELSIPYVGETISDNQFLGYIFGATSYTANAEYVPETLKTLSLTSEYAVLAQYALYKCSSINTVNIFNETISDKAFYSCSGLEKVMISYHTTSITAPFYNCSDVVIYGYNDSRASSIASDLEYTFISLGDIPHEEYRTGTCGYDITWTLYYDHSLEIFGKGGMPTYSSESDYPWHKYKDYIYKVNLNEGIENLGTYTFKNYTNLQSASLPNTLYSIGNSTFYGCTSLNSIVIPDHVSTIDENAFYSCTNLNNISVGSGLTAIKKNAFYGCNALRSIELPDSLLTIEAYAFYNCSLLADIDMSEKLTSIGDYAFRNCTALSDFYLPYTTVSISDNAFYDCTMYLTIVGYENSYAQKYATKNSIPFRIIDDQISDSVSQASGTLGDIEWKLTYDGVLHITGVGSMRSYSSASYYPWYTYRSYIKSVEINDISSVGNSAFNNYSTLESVQLDSSVKTIEDYAFYNCSMLNSVKAENGLEHIMNNTFRGCTSLNGISLPETVNTIGSYAFYGCSSLSTITIPESVTVINDYTFAECSKLQNVYLSKNTASIRDHAFRNCTAILSIDIPYTVQTISSNSFYNHIAAFKLRGYADTYAQDYAIANGINFELISSEKPAAIMDQGNLGDDFEWKLTYGGELIISGNGEMPDYSSSEYSWYSYRNYIKSVKFESGVTKIGSYAFRNYDKLISVKIPDSVRIIGSYAFSGAKSLSAVEIGTGLTEICDYAFADCTSLAGINLPDTSYSIDKYVFDGCTSLINVDLGNKVSKIGDYAFYDCSALTNLEIPYTVINISSTSFKNITDKICFNVYDKSYAYRYAAASNISYNIIHPACDDIIYSGVFNNTMTWSITYSCKLILNGTGMMYNNKNGEWKSYSSLIYEAEVGNGVSVLGDYTFSDLKNITKVELPDSLKAINQYSFSGCTSLKSITIPDNVEVIEKYSFNGCSSLDNIITAKSLKEIASYAFNGCTALKTIYYNGTKSEWNSISIDSNNTNFINADVIYNSENLTYSDLQLSVNGDVCNAQVTALNVSDGDVFAAAAYSSNGDILNIKLVNVTNADRTIDLELQIPDDGTVKAFIWNKNMIPYINTACYDL